MKFYYIMEKLKDNRCASHEYLEAACAARNIEFVPIEAKNFDYAQDMSALIETPSILYRKSTTKRAVLLETMLLREGVASFFTTPESSFVHSQPWGDELRLLKAGIPIVPTIFNVDRDQDSRLGAYAAELGGFPIILKAAGGAHGSSVLRIDSIESLRSVLGYLAPDDNARFALRKYIQNARHIRLVVVGGDVVDAVHYLSQPDDFRTNAVRVPEVEPYDRSEETEHVFALVERAATVLGYEFGGVDVLLDEQGNATIAEVNSPCNFARNQMNTGVDIAGIMVDYLLKKTQA